MRVLFSSTSGAGHLLPLLSYAKVLVAKGHEVLVAGSEELRDPLRGAGFEHACFDRPEPQVLAAIWGRLGTAELPLAVFIEEFFAGADSQAAFPRLLEIVRAWEPQLIVRDSAEFAALVAAEVLSVRHVRVGVCHPLVEEQFCSAAVAPVDTLRGTAGLPADDGASLRAEPVFTAFPEFFADPAQSEATFATYRVGPAKESAPVAGSWKPPGDGLPLVYITFGTVATGKPEALTVYQTAVAAVAQLPVRALLTTGRGFDVSALGAIPTNVRVEAWVPQAEVFPHAAVLVCHGGSGTVLGGLAAGLPQVVVPLGADQPFNAQSVASIGAGLALKNPDAETLAAAIQRALDEPGFRRAARAASAEMAALPGIDDAVNALVEFAAR